MKILVVEDDQLMVQMIEAMLRQQGFTTSSVQSGADAIDRLDIYEYDLVLLDLHLKDGSGLTVLRHARAQGIRFPFMILSGDIDLKSKVAALDAGADDYLTKPFRIEELVARIQAIVRRSQGIKSGKLRVGPLEIDLSTRSASAHGQPLALTCKEYDLLEILALRKGRTVDKETILTLLYDGADEPSIKIIDVFMCKLRRKLSKVLGEESPIQTVWGRGYVLTEGTVQQSAPIGFLRAL